MRAPLPHYVHAVFVVSPMSPLSTVCKVAPVRTPPVALLRGHSRANKKIAAVFDGYSSNANLPFVALNDLRLGVSLPGLAGEFTSLEGLPNIVQNVEGVRCRTTLLLGQGTQKLSECALHR